MGLATLKAAAGVTVRGARARSRGCAIVLTYHRIADPGTDPQLLSVSPANFEEQIRAIARDHTTLTAGELFGLMRDGRGLPDRAVVVTIDDGYADAALSAAPVLERHGVRATVFVASGQVDSRREFWWDEVERIVLLAGRLPGRLSIETNGRALTSEVSGDLERTDEDAAREGRWNVTQPPRNERQRVYLALCEFMRGLDGPARAAAMASLREQTGAADVARPSHLALSGDQVCRMAAGPTFEIGAHTVSHVLLSALGPDAQREEIEKGKRALEEMTGVGVTSFSYPHGGRESYTRTTERIVKDAGFAGACANHFGIVLPWRDRFAAPRCPTEDLGADAFSARLTRWFDEGR